MIMNRPNLEDLQSQAYTLRANVNRLYEMYKANRHDRNGWKERGLVLEEYFLVRSLIRTILKEQS